MLRLVLLGLWVIATTLAAAYGAVLLGQADSLPEEATSEDLGTTDMRTELTAVPILRGGEVTGYVIIQLSFQADNRIVREVPVEPHPYLIDAAIRVILSATDIDFRRLRGSELDRLTAAIAHEANTRIGQQLVRTVLVQQLNFVGRDEIRTNWIRPSDG